MKFLVSVGHTPSGTAGCGAVGLLDESKCTRQISPLVVQKLEALGHTAKLLQIDYGTTTDYVERARQANNCGGDLFVEIHLNAGGGTGCEVWTTPGSNASTYAIKVSESISNAIGIKNRGHKTTTGLYVLKHTSMPAMLVECCFVDNQIDYNAYNADKIASAIVNGLTGQTYSAYKLGWNKSSKGWWYCTDADKGYYYTSNDGWKLIDNEWYIFDSQGYAYHDSWYKSGDYWYYLKASCAMARNEWLYINDNFYYFGDQGGMYYNCYTPDGYWVDEDGAWDFKGKKE